jgi:hypothetical protein
MYFRNTGFFCYHTNAPNKTVYTAQKHFILHQKMFSIRIHYQNINSASISKFSPMILSSDDIFKPFWLV